MNSVNKKQKIKKSKFNFNFKEKSKFEILYNNKKEKLNFKTKFKNYINNNLKNSKILNLFKTEKNENDLTLFVNKSFMNNVPLNNFDNKNFKRNITKMSYKLFDKELENKENKLINLRSIQVDEEYFINRRKTKIIVPNIKLNNSNIIKKENEIKYIPVDKLKIFLNKKIQFSNEKNKKQIKKGSINIKIKNKKINFNSFENKKIENNKKFIFMKNQKNNNFKSFEKNKFRLKYKENKSLEISQTFKKIYLNKNKFIKRVNNKFFYSKNN